MRGDKPQTCPAQGDIGPGVAPDEGETDTGQRDVDPVTVLASAAVDEACRGTVPDHDHVAHGQPNVLAVVDSPPEWIPGEGRALDVRLLLKCGDVVRDAPLDQRPAKDLQEVGVDLDGIKAAEVIQLERPMPPQR